MSPPWKSHEKGAGLGLQAATNSSLGRQIHFLIHLEGNPKILAAPELANE